MFWGNLHYASFASDFTRETTPDFSWLQGAWYSATILAILGMHELGHYYACRYYRVDASPPYFLPLPFFFGTMGAFIRIRQPIPTKPVLFDIGAAGPIAGFIVAVPALFIGLWLSRAVVVPEPSADLIIITFGEPLLYQAAEWMVWGELPPGHAISLHPMGLAAWFGLLATALNLFPIAQLDGGHISYATLGSRSTMVTIGSIVAAVGLAYFSRVYILWALLLLVMVVMLGPRHPHMMDDHIPLDRTRRWIALGTAAIFVLCFTPAPMEFSELIATP